MGVAYYVDGVLSDARTVWSMLEAGAGYIVFENVAGVDVQNTWDERLNPQTEKWEYVPGSLRQTIHIWANGSSEPAIGEAGGGFSTMSTGDPLPECAKRAILEFYAVVGNSSAERFKSIMGALDAVRTHIGFPSWTPPARGERLTGKPQADAFTYFYDIYFRSASNYDLSTSAGMALLVHEFTHVMQYRETSQFPTKYLLAWANWGSGENNPYERRAYVNQRNALELFTKRPELLCP